MEISRKKRRERVLDKAKQMRTCLLSRQLCFLVRMNAAVLESKDVEKLCMIVSKQCKEFGCHEPAELCEKAAHAVKKDEQVYLDLCLMSCKKCPAGNPPQPRQAPPTPPQIPYVA